MDSAYYHYNKAGEYYHAVSNDYYAAKMTYNMAVILAAMKNYTGSEILTIKAIEALKPLTKYNNLYKAYNHLGVIYKELQEYDKAIRYYQVALDYLNKVGDENTNTESTLNNMGIVFQKTNMHEEAIELFQEALIDHMREFKPISGTYHGEPVYQYLD